jgi:RNA polymerase sigma-70 factor (ECF subfamily)
MTSPTLTELLLRRPDLQSLPSGSVSQEVDATLLEIVVAARSVFPLISLPCETFIPYLGERLESSVSVPLALRQMHAVDLYLACACGLGDVHAFAAFEYRCLRDLDHVLAKLAIDADATEEVKQEIRSRVLAGDGGRAQIRDFTGRGNLRGWVRVMAIRLALLRKQRARREVPLDEDQRLQHLVACDAIPDPRKEHYRTQFKTAFEAALRALPGRERTLLRQHYLDGLSIDEIGVLYRVHRSTAARLLVRARALVLEATRSRMISGLGVQPPELDSIMRMIRSRIEISLHVLLRRKR